MVVREHTCTKCQRKQLSIQFMLDPMALLEMGILPLISSELTRKHEATPAGSGAVAAG